MPTPTNPCILLVDDDDDLRAAIVVLLEAQGYKVREARNGKEALGILAEMTTPCLILLDFLMPVMNGVEFLRAVAEDHRLAPIPVVMVAGVKADPATPGIRRFIRKPFSPDLLIAAVRDYCGDPP